MDDDLARIHPRNPAFAAMHPKSNTAHNWLAAQQACRDATLVTCSTEQLLQRYAPHGRGRVLHNYVPKHFLEVPHRDGKRITWCGSLHSHPDDLSVLGPSIWSLVRDGAEFQVIGSGVGVDDALGLDGRSVPAVGTVEFDYWPVEVAKSGVTIAPLADTSFNAAKSWLKPLEAMACGVPVVMSPREEYTLLQRESGVGLLAEKPKQWEGCLKKLLRDERFRIEQSEAGRAAVKEQFVLEDQAWQWAEAWSWAIEYEKRVRRTP
jgi:glycosyltransferase involved in cell wall biosynthesis